MSRFTPWSLVSAALAFAGGCSDLGEAPVNGGGTGGTGGSYFVDPLPVDKDISVGCKADILPVPFVARWELSVDPTPIIAMTPFSAELNGTIVVSEAELDQSQRFVGGGYKRLNLLEASATVLVHGSAADSPVGNTGKLLMQPTGVFECTYDAQGEVGPEAGPDFPACDPGNDNPDGSNADCFGLAGEPRPENRCGQFITILTSNDCEECAEVHGKGDDCSDLGFCTIGDLRIPLQTSNQFQFYEAGEAGGVFFGFDDDDGGQLEVPRFDAETGPNGFRVLLRGTKPLAVECTMVGSGSSPSRFDPVSESDFISFTVEAP